MIEVRDATLSYRNEVHALNGVSLTLRAGERVVVLGTNGSGKSSLARLVNGSMLPDTGEVVVDGISSSQQTTREVARRVGLVRQDPRNQIVSSLVFDEVAFGPCNLGLPADEVRLRVERALATCGVRELAESMTNELSGGQQQLVAVAGVLAMEPAYLVLDEADSQLDDATRRKLKVVVRELVAQSVGVLEVAHDCTAVFGADRVLVLAAGRVAWEGTPQEFFADKNAIGVAGFGEDMLALAIARAVRGGYELGEEPELDPERLARFLSGQQLPEERAELESAPEATRHELIASKVGVSYVHKLALQEVSLAVPTGLTLVVGKPGSGKSTLARVLTGVLEPDQGEVCLDGRQVRAGQVGLAFQRPEDQLFCDTVFDDIAYGPRAQGLDGQDVENAVYAAADLLGVGDELLDRSPFELSGGQTRRVALAGVIAARPCAYVFDEPTAGLDGPSRQLLHRLVGQLVFDGAPVIIVTHDAGEWLQEAREVVFLRDGAIALQKPAQYVRTHPQVFDEVGLAAPLEVRMASALTTAFAGPPVEKGAEDVQAL